MRQIIGYYSESFTPEFLNRQGVTKNEVIGTIMQKCFAVAVDSNTISENKNHDDIIQKMISENIGIVASFNHETCIAEFKFENPIV